MRVERCWGFRRLERVIWLQRWCGWVRRIPVHLGWRCRWWCRFGAHCGWHHDHRRRWWWGGWLGRRCRSGRTESFARCVWNEWVRGAVHAYTWGRQWRWWRRRRRWCWRNKRCYRQSRKHHQLHGERWIRWIVEYGRSCGAFSNFGEPYSWFVDTSLQPCTGPYICLIQQSYGVNGNQFSGHLELADCGVHERGCPVGWNSDGLCC